jgi:uncharacterized protein YkwD
VSDLGFSPIDAAVLVLVAFGAWSGYRAGFVATTYSLASWILAAAAAIAFEGPVAKLIDPLVHLPRQVETTIAFVGLIALVEMLFAATAYVAVRPIVAAIRRGAVDLPDRVLGIVPSVARTLFIVAVLVLAVEALPISSEIKAAVEGSRTARIVNDQVETYQPQIASFTSQLGGGPLLVTKLGEEDTQKLDLPDGLALSPDPVAEKELFDLVNQERTQRGLAALVWDLRLVPVARAHSEEMFKLKYFGHQSPVSGSPFDRLKAAGIAYSRAGENLAYAQSVAVAHEGLMDSEGHRENILRPEFTHLGVGVMNAGLYGRMFVQLFLTP